jgi:lipopolysaccharide transport system permease protein
MDVRKNAPGFVTIQPLQGWSQLGLDELWEYRDLVWLFTVRNIRSRYRQMALGPLWSVLKPLVNMVIFSVIFGTLAKLPSDGVPYPIFAYTALLPWSYFSGVAGASTGSLVSQMAIISKVYFPRLAIPISNVFSGLFDFFISIFILFGMMLYYDISLSWKLVLLPLYILLAAVTGLGIGLWTATLTVRYRDVGTLVGYGLQVLKYASPIAYSASLIPENWMTIYRLNPIFWVVEGFRWALLGTGQAPQPLMAVSAGLSLILLISGTFVFRRTERTIVDWL